MNATSNINQNTNRLPAEWERQSAVLIVWPHRQSDWRESLEVIDTVYEEMCMAITSSQPCLIVCFDEEHKKDIQQRLSKKSVNKENCIFFTCKTNGTWCRDYAAIATLKNKEIILNNFVFNGWGEKYDSILDNQCNQSLLASELFKCCSVIHHDFVLEGGSIDTDGQGTLLTTSNCLAKRHPEKSENQLDQYFSDTLGIKRTIYLKNGCLTGDDTDCHVDNLARFVETSTIVYAACRDPEHPDYDSLNSMEEELHKLKQARETYYKLIPIYLPEPIIYDGKVLPASYINFLITNDSVLLPVFDQSSDNEAKEILKICFPDRNIIAINSTELIKEYGGIHCATMQFPEGVIKIDYE